MTLPCIPTEAEDGRLGPLVLPGQALVCNNPAIRQLVSADQLARLQDKFFVHPGVCYMRICSLGVVVLGLDSWLSLCSAGAIAMHLLLVLYRGAAGGWCTTCQCHKTWILCTWRPYVLSFPACSAGVPVLLHCRELRTLLGVREFDPQEVISLIKDVAVAGELPSSNIPQLRQLLVCVFGLLFASSSQHPQHWAGAAAAATPARKGSAVVAAGAVGSSIRVQRLLRELRQVPLLPVYARPGVLVAAQGGVLSTDDGSVSSGMSKGTSTVFLPVGFQAVEAGVGSRSATPASTPSR